jgi:hypothetical protein
MLPPCQPPTQRESYNPERKIEEKIKRKGMHKRKKAM